MKRQRRQTVLLAVAVLGCHLLLLAAMQWIWQPRSRIARLPVPVFARILTPQAVQSVAYSTDVPTEKTAASSAVPADTVGTADSSQPDGPQAQSVSQPEAGAEAAEEKPVQRRQLWAPLPPDAVPVFRQTQHQKQPLAQSESRVDAQAEQQTADAADTLPSAAVKAVAAVAATPVPTAPAPASAAVAAAAEKTPAEKPPAAPLVLTNPMDAWPPTTRLRYTVGGNYRGKVSGTAQVQWIKQGTRYQSQVDMDFGLIPGVQMTSQGRIFPTGLQPTVFEEKQAVGGWRSVSFDISHITVHSGRKVENPDKRIGQMLDPAAQFVEFSHRFRTGSLPLKAGTLFDFWLGRPEAIYRWQYSISGPMLLALPQYGDVVVHHVKPTPLSLKGRGNRGYVVEMWYAPEMQYLPVRIKLNMGREGYIDLMLRSVEQAAAEGE